MIPPFLLNFITIMAVLFIFVVGLVAAVLLILFLIDISQRKNAVRHNYPVLARLRPLFEHLGKFFRQYFITTDRSELPFNREQRSWVYRAADGTDPLGAFGSTKNLRPRGTVSFVNALFPLLESEAEVISTVIVGPYCRIPYKTSALFHVSGMSYGAISKPAVQALSKGAAMAGCWVNTGEGGLSPYHLEGGCDLVFQIGTAKYGVRTPEGALDQTLLAEIAGHSQVCMFEVKLSQGAKPGQGGVLPASKVTEEIARIRGIPVREASLSPNRFPEIESSADLLDFIERVRVVSGKPTGFKTVIGAYGWLDELCEEILRRGIQSAPDFITVDSADGGSGAAPMSLMDGVGLPLHESLPMVVNKLTTYGLRDRVRVIASGKMITSTDVAWALCAGADFIQNARGFMFALGCIQAMRCHKNTCPTGVTTHTPRRQRGLDPKDKAVKVMSYAQRVTHDVEVIAHACGVSEPRRLKRLHARVATESGRTVPLDELYPKANTDTAA